MQHPSSSAGEGMQRLLMPMLLLICFSSIASTSKAPGSCAAVDLAGYQMKATCCVSVLKSSSCSILNLWVRLNTAARKARNVILHMPSVELPCAGYSEINGSFIFQRRSITKIGHVSSAAGTAQHIVDAFSRRLQKSIKPSYHNKAWNS